MNKTLLLLIICRLLCQSYQLIRVFMPELETRYLEWPHFLGMFIYMSAYACSIWLMGIFFRKRPYSLTICFWYLNLRELYGGVVSATYFAWYHNIFMIILIVLGPESDEFQKGTIVYYATIGRCSSCFLIYWFPGWKTVDFFVVDVFFPPLIHLCTCISMMLAVRVLVSRLTPMEAHRPVNPPAPPPLVLTNMFSRLTAVIIEDPHDSKYYLRMFWCCCCICLCILIDSLVVSHVFCYDSLSDLLGRFRQQQRRLNPNKLWACLPLFLFAKCSEPYTHRHSRDMSPMLCQIRRLGSTGDD